MNELEAHEEAQDKYWKSEKGKETRKRYADSEKGKATRLRYLNSDKSKITQLRYQLSKKGSQTYKKRLQTRGLLLKCEKYLKDNPDKTIVDFIKEANNELLS